jgi:beta-galactosidase
MNNLIRFVFFLLCFTNVVEMQAQSFFTLMDDDWKFALGKDEQAKETAYDDKNWRTVFLPHDWGIEDLPGTSSPFSPDAVNGVSVGFTTGGTGWYRKWITIGPQQKDKIVKLYFEGIYMNADVWINGKQLGTHPYGYTSFWYDITNDVKPGKNLLVVRVKHEGRTSRWYAGSGVYRHVWLHTSEKLSIQPWHTVVATQEIVKSNALLAIRSWIVNSSDNDANVKLVTRVLNQKGVIMDVSIIDKKIPRGDTISFLRHCYVAGASLWSPDKPVLYTVVEELHHNGVWVDKTETKTGIRTIAWDTKNGFQLNGKTIKLKGGCVHQDNGPLGVKAFDRAEERRVELLKASGYNALRCSHNPPSTAFLDACDRLGMMVIDEAFDMWADRKNQQDYHLYFNEWWKRDVESMVLRDRNHPSIIMWSTGNEIPKREQPQVVEVAKKISDHIRSLDSTRPITCGVNGVEPNKDPFFSTLDIAGYNYARDKYDSDHVRLPQRVMMAAESFPLEAFDYWMAVKDKPWVIGDFVWTAFDYIGEASIGWLGYPQNKNFYPWNLAYCGDIDVCGWKRPQSYYRDALWKTNQLGLFVSPPVPSFSQTNPKPEPWSKWNWADVVADWNWSGPGKDYRDSLLTVTTYSSCDEVELRLNGKSLGRKPTNRSTRFIASWQVPYRSGTLMAVGYTKGRMVNSSKLVTAAPPAVVKLTADRTILKAGGQDLSYITVELTDKNGVLNPKAENNIQFEIEGPAVIEAVGNANPVSIESYQLPQRKAWRGKCLVIVRAGHNAGNVVLKASGDGLKLAIMKLTVR